MLYLLVFPCLMARMAVQGVTVASCHSRLPLAARAHSKVRAVFQIQWGSKRFLIDLDGLDVMAWPEIGRERKTGHCSRSAPFGGSGSNYFAAGAAGAAGAGAAGFII
jgi:hypothetical protein